MADTKWLKQDSQPLFPDILWSRPENRRHAGKLMVAGGHSQSFSAPSQAFMSAVKAGAGTVRVLLPSSLLKTVGSGFAEAEFAASTPIGSFGRAALDAFLDLAEWSDGVLLAGDFGKNSETALLLESFLDRYKGQLNLCGDSIDYFAAHAEKLVTRQNTIITATLSQLQKLAIPSVTIRHTADLAQIAGQLAEWTAAVPLEIVSEHSGNILAAQGGRVSTTKGPLESGIAAYASVWRLQQPEKPFEALTTAIYCYLQ